MSITDIKKGFNNHFLSLLNGDKMVKLFFNEILTRNSAYIVGGYFRDFLNQKRSRDIDVIADISRSELLSIVEGSKLIVEINRHGGIKIMFDSIQLDVWALDDNWAFKNKLVKLNEGDKLNSIAKGCFYNYDSLVIDLRNFSYNLRYYNEFRATNKLEILQSRPVYKTLNPTTEANILRAFYIKFKFGATYSKNTYKYLFKKVGNLNDKKDSSAIQSLLQTRKKYSKYSELSESLIFSYLDDLKGKDNPDSQLLLEI